MKVSKTTEGKSMSGMDEEVSKYLKPGVE